MEHGSDSDTNYNWFSRNDHQKLDKRPVRVRNRRTSQDHSNKSTGKIGQNTEKSPGDSRRFAITKSPVKDHQLTLVWKAHKWW